MKTANPFSLSFVLLISGCAGRGQTLPQSAYHPVNCAGPLVTVVLPDFTGSATKNLTPRLSVADFEPLIQGIVNCGGELAVGAVSTRSNRPLIRFRTDQPEQPPLPTDPQQNSQTYARKHSAELRERRRIAAEDAARRERAAKDLTVFRASLKTLLDKPASARCSDVAGALRRSSLMQGEPDYWPSAPLKYTVLVSDAEHNCGTARYELTPGVRLVMVNGAPGLGILAGKQVARVESFPAATGFILSELYPRIESRNRNQRRER